ncbi:tail protein [Dinoroseobacter phage vB_DshS-R5C]|uniref:GTA-like protein n=1 Tax=Dinoroseobacter phage vB_DshS-R5C TaxID=1965368 RepID=A0A1V0DY94_9CAUD|nr:tail protein [Dinoroseobacter phage vB_DshS-R5C]ARB06121.1 GTA-like protein [Dinoroseobacter phage vB_DshS-R5C]
MIQAAVTVALGAAYRALTPDTIIQNEEARLEEAKITSASEGATIAQLWGRQRVPGQIIWATKFREVVEVETETQSGGKGGGPDIVTETTTYRYFQSFAVGLCEANGARIRVGRIWADGVELDQSAYTIRFYDGSETQSPDSAIVATEGDAPAFRGLAYLVFDDFEVSDHGNRIPQITVEVTRSLDDDPDRIEEKLEAVTMIPGANEFIYGTRTYYTGGGENSSTENVSQVPDTPDLKVSLDQLEDDVTNIASVELVVSWFGTDLRCGNCEVKPKVDFKEKTVKPVDWRVATETRSSADLVSEYESGKVAFGGTPADVTVREALTEIKGRGHRAVFYPFIMMDIENGNSLPNPYSDNAATTGQPVYPWRGRITCSPAAGYVGSPDKTAAAGTQVASFVGTAAAGDFGTWNGTNVPYTGPSEWSFRRMVLHYAHLCKDILASGDAFIIGTEMVGMTTVRDSASNYPFVNALVTLLADVKSILPSGVDVSYAADWSEYHSHRPSDGSGDVYFNMDPLWAVCDFIGIDNYLPLTDWRTADEYDYRLDTLMDGVEGGEYYDYFYASDADRDANTRSTIVDGLYSISGLAIDDTISPSTNGTSYNPSIRQNNVSFSCRVRLPSTPAEGVLYKQGGPSLGCCVVLRDSGSTLRLRSGDGGALGASTSDTVVLDVDTSTLPMDGELHTIAWDFRVNPGRVRLWIDGVLIGTENTTGSGALDGNVWCGTNDYGYLDDFGDDGMTGEPVGAWPDTTGAEDLLVYQGELIDDAGPVYEHWIYRQKDMRNWWLHDHFDRPGGTRDTSSTSFTPGSKPIWFTEFGCAAIDKGANQPNVFLDPKSSESFTPHFSTGARDDLIQRRYAEAWIKYWAANSPSGMISTADMFAWTWDARPFPNYPYGNWGDRDNWRQGHWLNGRLNVMYLKDVCRDLGSMVGLTDDDFDFTGLEKFPVLVRGHLSTTMKSPREVIEELAMLNHASILESEGLIKVLRKRLADRVDLSADDLISTSNNPGGFEIVTAQETEVPREVTITFSNESNAFQSASANGKRQTGNSQLVQDIRSSTVIEPEEARNICEELLNERVIGRQTFKGSFPRDILRYDPGDLFGITLRGRDADFKIAELTIGSDVQVEATRCDKTIYTPRSVIAPLPTTGSGISTPGSALVEFIDIPLLTAASLRPWAPRVVAFQNPWPGGVVIYQDDGSGGYSEINRLTTPATMGETVDVFTAGPVAKWDNESTLAVSFYAPTTSILSLSETSVLNGSNTIAVQTSKGWELVQFRTATLQGDGSYHLTGLLRGQNGTEYAMDTSLAAGARVVFINAAWGSLNMTQGQIGIEKDYRYGPAGIAVGDDRYQDETYTPSGRSLMPFSPVHLKRKTSGTDHVLQWIRRSRINADTWDGTVPLNEETEAYEVDIYDGSSVVRTIEVAGTNSVTYTAAQQTADFGSTQSRLKFTVYQISAAVGRGEGATYDDT